MISGVEFRNIIKKLNVGLTTVEINQLFDYISVHPDGLMNYKSFINRILLK